MAWHVVSVNSRMELEIANRISAAGFIAHCPTYLKRYGIVRRGRHFYSQKIDVLFPSYIFLQRTWINDDDDDAFRYSEFETSKTRLTVFRRRLISDEQMTVVNSTANDLSLMQSRTKVSLKIKRGELMRLLHGDWTGKTVRAKCDERSGRVKIEFEDHKDWHPITVPADALERIA